MVRLPAFEQREYPIDATRSAGDRRLATLEGRITGWQDRQHALRTSPPGDRHQESVP